MKKRLFVLVCALLLLLASAAPALASPKVETHRLPHNASIFFDGWWIEYSPSTGSYWDEVSWHQAFDPADPELSDFYAPVSKHRPIYAWAQWIGVDHRFMSRDLPQTVLLTYDVTGPHGYSRHYSTRWASASWTGPYIWDEWWNTYWQDAWADGWTPVPYNTRFRVVYGNNMLLSLGPFRHAGKYTVTYAWWTAKPTVEYWDPAGPVYYPAGGQSGGETSTMWVE
jgi:hypothetical protein